MCVYFRTKFQVSRIILASLDGVILTSLDGVILPLPLTPKQTPKKPTPIRVNIIQFKNS